MLNNEIRYSANFEELFSVVARSGDKYAIITMTGHCYGYAMACISVFSHTDKPGFHDESISDLELTKEQITHFLSLDCPDAFIAYALTLCPCSPETSSCASKCELDEVDGGNPVSFARSYSKKKDITYLQALKDIKAQIEFLNKCAFDKSILTSDEHFALLGIEEELNQLIHFDPIRPTDNGMPLRYDHFNCHDLPSGLE